MDRSTWLAAAIPALLALLPPVAAAGQTVEFVVRFTEGETFRIETITTAESGLAGAPQIRLRQVMGGTREVLSVDDEGFALLRDTVDSVLVDSDGPGGRERFDSADPEAATGSFTSTWAALMGGVFEFAVGPGWTARPRADTGVEAPRLFPEGPVSVGESWTVEFARPSRDAPLVHELTLEAIETGSGRRTALVRYSVNDPLLRSSVWTTSGHYRFDLDRGMIVEDVMEVRLQAATEGMTMESVNRTETRVFP
jgi:hypothetical protein